MHSVDAHRHHDARNPICRRIKQKWKKTHLIKAKQLNMTDEKNEMWFVCEKKDRIQSTESFFLGQFTLVNFAVYSNFQLGVSMNVVFDFFLSQVIIIIIIETECCYAFKSKKTGTTQSCTMHILRVGFFCAKSQCSDVLWCPRCIMMLKWNTNKQWQLRW